MDELVLEAMQSRYVRPHDLVESASARDEYIRSVIEKFASLDVKDFELPTVAKKSRCCSFLVS